MGASTPFFSIIYVVSCGAKHKTATRLKGFGHSDPPTKSLLVLASDAMNTMQLRWELKLKIALY